MWAGGPHIMILAKTQKAEKDMPSSVPGFSLYIAIHFPVPVTNRCGTEHGNHHLQNFSSGPRE